MSRPASVARAVENAIEAFENDGFPEGMGERLVCALEEAYVTNGKSEGSVAEYIGEVTRELRKIVFSNENHATSAGTM